ncbi:uncharacterized protein B0H18DRAFT_1124221 [Fomitopsis serialis]|uniref:uncharacterized protein n=1 Tax=Fomitopsis serialis TaxID=139415 RepID=UPI002007C3D5|nr:uncharacterized protein B0H18DRAFT_1124221 [Neoantrodia serialis]KAH9916492.1 hypothetical protein B0H18DRAFT_1124221 [Neoantrodia serialis]
MANRDAEIEGLQAQIARLQSASTKLAVRAPKEFEGKPDDVAPFLRRLDTYFSATNNDTIDDQRKIAYAVTLIDSRVMRLLEEQHFHEEEKAVAEHRHRFATWDDFKKLSRKPSPEDTNDSLCPEVPNPRCQSNVTDEKTLAGLFKAAVRPELLGKMLNIENPPDTMEKWYDLVLRLDSRQVYGTTSSYDGGGSR